MQLSCMLVCILCTLIVGLILGCPKFFMHLQYLQGKITMEQKKSYQCIDITETVLRWLFTLLKIYYFKKCNTYLNQFIDSINLIGTSECSDPIANKTFQTFASILIGTESKNSTGLIFTYLSFFICAYLLVSTIIHYLKSR